MRTEYTKGQQIGVCIYIKESAPQIRPNGEKVRRALFKCPRCGSLFESNLYCVKSLNSRSCGCLSRELAHQRRLIHGASVNYKTTKEFRAWCSMRTRCSNEKCKAYPNYGGRGITVCDEWKASFSKFLEDMGTAPTKDHTLERSNNDKGYCPSNCVWATRSEQSRNKRNFKPITYQGQEKTLREWSKELGVSPSGIARRLKVLKMTVEEAFTTPFQKSNRKSHPLK